MTRVDIRNFTQRKASGFPFAKAAQAILPEWDLSLVFAGKTRAQHLNETLRGKSYAPNVLSYETSKKSGEIIICLEVAQQQAPSYGLSYADFVGFLFIHGLLHLKGQRHGTTMERYEQTYLRRFAHAIISYGSTTTSNRHRHRNPPDKNRGGGRSRRS